ncbi:MAG: glycosyltransferase family 2 protein [Smithella sp.]
MGNHIHNSMPVDIIVTTYKRYDLLQEALKSVASQSYPHWKCWIAEDGESKETHEAVKPFLQDNRFVYLPGIHAGFPAVSRNHAIRQGTAPYIALLDDDDLWLPRKLEYQIAFLKSNPNCVLLGCNGFWWKGIREFNNVSLYFKRKMLGKIHYTKLVNQNHLINSSVVFRRSAIEKSGLFNEDPFLQPGQDYELWLRMGVLGEIWNLAEPLVIYRETPSSHYNKKPDRYSKYKSFAKIYASALKGIEDLPVPLFNAENVCPAEVCRRERDFYLAGPRFLGRFRHEMPSKIKHFFQLGSKRKHIRLLRLSKRLQNYSLL